MNRLAQKEAIEESLNGFGSLSLEQASLRLFDVLGYRSEKRLVLRPNNAATFLETFVQQKPFNKEQALVDDWETVDFLFQLTDAEIQSSIQDKLSFYSKGKYDNSIIESYLFFAISLTSPETRVGNRKGYAYTRTELSLITRCLNRLFDMPVMVLFCFESRITIAVIDRRLHKRESSKDVLEKVTLIKDINLAQPHRAHVEILFDLSLPQLIANYTVGNFVELHNAWRKTLDTSALNKRFYHELANWYFWAVQNVEFPDQAEKDVALRNATSVIRLTTRLIFVWFVKEKGLIPDDLFNQSKLRKIINFSDANKSTYYKAILQNLFFATLNTEMNKDKPGSRKFRGRNKTGGRDQHYLIHNVFRYENYFSQPEAAINKYFDGIPFLNGGLFECLDKPLTINGKEKVDRIDGFSDRPDNSLKVPDELFFAEEKPVDLNEVYGTNNKIYKVRGLLNILHSYKFTVDENTPIEEEIALDPELLGKVFENLLASYNPETQTTARKQTGSFYTPREIVNYMVDESLIGYLSNVISTNGEADERLRNLLSYTEEPLQLTQREVDKIIGAIDNLKFLDPACGSGAFLMGALHKLVYVLGKLDPGNEKWKQKQIDKVMEVPDLTIREKLTQDVEEAFQKNELDYGRKLYLIENCIFGVDIQPIAVQITKLRFFISLVVDQRIDFRKDNLGIRPLPNLETKFVAANTLIPIEKPAQLALRNPEIDRKEINLKRVRERHFTARTIKTKEKYRDEDKKLRQELSDLLRKDGFPPGITERLSRWNPYEQNASADFFDPEWMFGNADGFNIVIGNPPYLRVQGLQQTQPQFMPLYRERYVSAKGSFDIYALFVERGYQLLSRRGQLAYILPHKFFQASFGQGLRKLLTKQKAVRQIVRFGSEQVFEESTTYTCLLFLTRQPNSSFDLFEVKTLERGREVLEAAQSRQEHPDYVFEHLPEPTDKDWDFTIGESNKVLNRLNQHPKRLNDFVRKIFQGIPTGADKVFVLKKLNEDGQLVNCYSKALGREVEIERELLKPFLMGKDVHRYEPVIAENVVIFPYDFVNGQSILLSQSKLRTKFPSGYKYLNANKEQLVAREKGRFADNWFSFSRPQNLVEFETVKIMTPDICNSPQMTIDLKGKLYHTTTLYSFVFKRTVEETPKYFLGVLNSKVLWYFLSITGTLLRGGYLRFKTEYLKPFPIPESTSKEQQSIETLVDYLLYIRANPPKKENHNTSSRHSLMTAYFEQIVDGLVYELYFPEEFSSSRNRLSNILNDAALLPLQSLPGKKYEAIEEIFQRLYKQDHPLRKAIYFLDTIEAVRVIEAKGRENFKD